MPKACILSHNLRFFAVQTKAVSVTALPIPGRETHQTSEASSSFSCQLPLWLGHKLSPAFSLRPREFDPVRQGCAVQPGASGFPSLSVSPAVIRAAMRVAWFRPSDSACRSAWLGRLGLTFRRPCPQSVNHTSFGILPSELQCSRPLGAHLRQNELQCAACLWYLTGSVVYAVTIRHLQVTFRNRFTFSKAVCTVSKCIDAFIALHLRLPVIRLILSRPLRGAGDLTTYSRSPRFRPRPSFPPVSQLRHAA